MILDVSLLCMILIIAQFHTPQTPFDLEETITMIMILIMTIMVHNAHKSHLCSLIYQKTFTLHEMFLGCDTQIKFYLGVEKLMSRVVYGPEIWIYQTCC